MLLILLEIINSSKSRIKSKSMKKTRSTFNTLLKYHPLSVKDRGSHKMLYPFPFSEKRAFIDIVNRRKRLIKINFIIL